MVEWKSRTITNLLNNSVPTVIQLYHCMFAQYKLLLWHLFALNSVDIVTVCSHCVFDEILVERYQIVNCIVAGIIWLVTSTVQHTCLSQRNMGVCYDVVFLLRSWGYDIIIHVYCNLCMFHVCVFNLHTSVLSLPLFLLTVYLFLACFRVIIILINNIKTNKSYCKSLHVW